FVFVGPVAPHALAQDEDDGALDVTALLQLGRRLGGDVPGGRDAQARAPEDVRHVCPDGAVLVREHDDLKAVVRHVTGHRGVPANHLAARVVAGALDGGIATAIPCPFGGGGGRVLAEPGDEIFGDLFVRNCVGVRWIGDVDVVFVVQSIRGLSAYGRCDAWHR